MHVASLCPWDIGNEREGVSLGVHNPLVQRDDTVVTKKEEEILHGLSEEEALHDIIFGADRIVDIFYSGVSACLCDTAVLEQSLWMCVCVCVCVCVSIKKLQQTIQLQVIIIGRQLRVCVSRKGGTWVGTPTGCKRRRPGLGKFRKPLLGVGWAILLPCA